MSSIAAILGTELSLLSRTYEKTDGIGQDLYQFGRAMYNPERRPIHLFEGTHFSDVFFMALVCRISKAYK